MDPAVSLLIKARAVIEDESAWTQGVLARSKYNRVIGPKAPGACRFCAFGALAHVSEENGPDNPIWRRATDLLDAAAIQIAPDLATGDTKSLRPAAYINDEGEHADVLRMYDLAIAPFGVDALKLSAPPSPSPAGEKGRLSHVQESGMSELPVDIDMAIEVFDSAAQSWGWADDMGTSAEGADALAAYEKARAALDAVILKHLGSSVPDRLRDVILYAEEAGPGTQFDARKRLAGEAYDFVRRLVLDRAALARPAAAEG